MNRKGFTLIELLVTLALLAIISGIAITGIISVLNVSRKNEYKILEKNIKSAALMYYEDCEYGNLNKDNCQKESNGNYAISIQTLVDYGFLTANNSGDIINPKNNKKINECKVIIDSDGKNVAINISECEGQ